MTKQEMSWQDLSVRCRRNFGTTLAFAAGAFAFMAIVIPNFRYDRGHRGNRACYANQKTIAGALEMYNLDYHTNIRHLDGRVLKRLTEGGYLRLSSIFHTKNTGHYRMVGV